MLLWRMIREVLGTVLPAVAIAVLINAFLAQGTYVHGQSMEPNLHTAQRLLIEKLSYRLSQPVRGDIVVVDVPSSEVPLIKRVIGLPGETVTVTRNTLYIDGLPVSETYLGDILQRDFGPVRVPDDHIFVMGDNRPFSNDSRSFGAVPVEDVIGRAWLSYWPPADIGFLDQN